MSARNPYYSGPVSDHFDGTRFFLPGQPPAARAKGSIATFADLRFSRERARWPKHLASPFAGAKPPPRSESLRVTLIGHASFLIQVAGLNLLIDPVWATRASPLPFLGPKRVNPPGVAMADLPPIDVVLVTHNHYDHLDTRSISRIWRAHRPRIVTPLGNDRTIRGGNRAMEMTVLDWHDRHALSADVSVTLVPAQHWSARGLNDRRMALWGSFLLHTPAGLIYHIGDTGYGDGATFRDIRARYGAPDLAILPIGAYEPRWFMINAHMNPADAVQAKADIGAPVALGHHWGTFQLTHEAILQPEQDLATARAAAGLDVSSFIAMRPGQTWEPA